jgi:hypothetical protein
MRVSAIDTHAADNKHAIVENTKEQKKKRALRISQKRERNKRSS